jgi:hypothetical protein
MEQTRSGTISIARDLSSQIGKSLLMSIPPVRRWRLQRPRTSFYINELDPYLRDNAFLGLNLLLEHAGGVKGKSVCEIGPGDFLTSGLSMLAAGARRYTVIDRFPGNYFGETARGFYREIGANWSRFYPDLEWNSAVDAGTFPDDCGHLIELIGKPIEDVRPAEKFDVVCSFQVGEHVSDIRVFARVHNELLAEGGIGLHRVDFGPHDVWSQYSDPTTFLRFPDFVWQMTGSNRGIPNRRRHNEFLDAFREANLDVEVLLVEHFDEQSVDLSRLDRQFLSMPKEDVLVKTAVYRLHRRSPV